MKTVKQKNGCDAVIASIASLCGLSYNVVKEQADKISPTIPLLPHMIDKVHALLNRFVECKKILRTDEELSKWVMSNSGNKALLIVVNEARLHCVAFDHGELHDPSREEGAWAETLNGRLFQVLMVQK